MYGILFNGGTLTVNDGTYVSDSNFAIRVDAGNLTVNNGIIKGSSGVVFTNTYADTFNLNGGRIIGTKVYGVSIKGTFNIGASGSNEGPSIYGYEYAVNRYNSGSSSGGITFNSGSLYAGGNGTEYSNAYTGTVNAGRGVIVSDKGSYLYDGVTYTVKSYIIVPVASITSNGETTYYQTLQEAINALTTTSKTINLLSNVTECVTIKSKTGVLDLGGFTLDCATSSTYTISISGTSTITIQNGTVKNSTSTYAVYSTSGGTLTISNNAIITGGSYGIYFYGGNVSVNSTSAIIHGIYKFSGNLVITGGSIIGSTHGVIASGGITKITGGTIVGSTHGVYVADNEVVLMG